MRKRIMFKMAASPGWISSAPAKSDVDDTYRCVRRKLSHNNFQHGGVKKKYSRGTVMGLRKGLIIGTSRGRTGQLCGTNRGSFRYRDCSNKRQTVKKLAWVSSSFKTRRGSLRT